MKFTLETVANIINDNTPDYIHAEVKGCWEDYGAKMWWETIVVSNTHDHYQALTPKLHNDIVNGYDIPFNKIQELIEDANKLLSE